MPRPRIRVALMALGLLWPAASQAATMMNLELRQQTGENFFARNVYQCNCTIEEFHSVPLPGPDWERNAPPGSGRFFLPDVGSSNAPAPPPGVPASLDLIPGVPGDEHVFIARVLDGTLIDTPQAPAITAQVARDTTFTFLAGRVIHTVTTPTGGDHVLFSVAEPLTEAFDLDVVGSLAPLSLIAMPDGWTYSSEVLTSDRTYVVENGIAEIVGLLGGAATFQRVFVPEPGVALLLAGGVVALAVRRRR